MAVGIVDRQKLVDIADAVREKKGITGDMTLDAIASNITSMPTADNNAKFDFSVSSSKSSDGLISYLTTVDLSNFDTSNYTSMYAMFQSFSALKNVDVSRFNTSKVTSMGSMFNDCSSLTSLDLSNFDTSKVTTMGNMFQDCKSLTSLDVSSFNTSKVKDYPSFAYMFNNCNSLKALDLSTFDFSNTYASSYVGLYGMFRDCKSLKTIKLPSTVTFNNSGISMGQMFYNCNSLTSLDLSNWDTSKVIDMGNMFFDCSKLSNLTLGTDWASNSSISSFDLSYSPLTHDSAIDVINKLATRSNSPVITFSNQVGLYQSEIDVATNKGWSVSGCRVLVDAETATVGQYALIDGVISKCVYVADTPQDWGQRIFSGQMLYVGDAYMYQWGGYEITTGITATDIGTGLTNTNSLIAMNLQSTDGTPTIWDAIKEFRNTHSERWFIPSMAEGVESKKNGLDDIWTSSEFNSTSSYKTFDYGLKYNSASKTGGYRAFAFTYV